MNNPFFILKNKIIEKKESEFEKGIFTFLNCYSYYIFRKNFELYKNFDGIYCDGIILKKMFDLVGVPNQRVSFDMTSLAPPFFEYCSKNNLRIALIGSEDSLLEKAADCYLNLYPQLNVIEKRSGYFSSDEKMDGYIDELILLNPDVIVVGMGAPLQDAFLCKLKLKGWRGIGYSCGGFFHQTAKNGKTYYPIFFDKYNLRWLYRMYDEPKLIKRYFIVYPISICFFFLDYLKSMVLRKKLF